MDGWDGAPRFDFATQERVSSDVMQVTGWGKGRLTRHLRG